MVTCSICIYDNGVERAKNIIAFRMTCQSLNLVMFVEEEAKTLDALATVSRSAISFYIWHFHPFGNGCIRCDKELCACAQTTHTRRKIPLRRVKMSDSNDTFTRLPLPALTVRFGLSFHVFVLLSLFLCQCRERDFSDKKK